MFFQNSYFFNLSILGKVNVSNTSTVVVLAPKTCLIAKKTAKRHVRQMSWQNQGTVLHFT